MNAERPSVSAAAGFSILELIVALAILLVGLLAVMTAFPLITQAQRDAELLTEAVALAQWKAEEIRRDDSANGRLVGAIQVLAAPTPPIASPADPRLAYAFSGQTRLYRNVPNAASDPRAASGVARVLVYYVPDGTAPSAAREVIHELRFDN